MKRTAWLIPVILLCLLLSSCTDPGGEEKTQEAVVVGFSQLGAESSWRIANTANMEEAAKQAGFGLMMENANQKQEKQIDAIRSFIAYQVDVIVFSPIVENGWDNVLREAKNAGIPVILMDRMISTDDDSLYTSYVGADFYAEGRRAGEYLIRKADTLPAEHMNIVEISGTIDSTPMRDRQKGFMDVISGDPRFTVLDSISGEGRRMRAAAARQIRPGRHRRHLFTQRFHDAGCTGRSGAAGHSAGEGYPADYCGRGKGSSGRSEGRESQLCRTVYAETRHRGHGTGKEPEGRKGSRQNYTSGRKCLFRF